MAFTFIMQTLSANLGGMLTPFGNPQNLYLYTYYNIGSAEFFKIMFLPFLFSIVLITICCFRIPDKEMIIEKSIDVKLQVKNNYILGIIYLFNIGSFQGISVLYRIYCSYDIAFVFRQKGA